MLISSPRPFVIAIASCLLMEEVSGQASMSLNFFRTGDMADFASNKKYDFSNLEKHSGHLVEKQKEIMKEVDSFLGESLEDQESLFEQQFTKFEQIVDDTTLICEGEVTMTWLKCPEDACDGEDDNSSCVGCKASFCKIDFDNQKESPEKYPSFIHLVGASNHCDSVLIQADFTTIVQECKEYDRQKRLFQSNENLILPKELPLSGLITELGHTDSEFVTNAIVKTNPSTRVIVEPQPVMEAMTVCDSYLKNRRKKFRGITESSICNREKAGMLLDDVIYMLSRTRDITEERVVIKTQPSSMQGIDIFDKKYPNVDWMFVYDDPTAEIGAHMGASRPDRANCVKTMKDPQPALIEIVEGAGLDLESLSLEEYCAASYAMLADKAVVEHFASTKGTFVRSENVMDVLPYVLKEIFHIPEPNNISTLDKMKELVNPSQQKQLHDKKVDAATFEQSVASEALYGPFYKQLESLQKTGN